MSTRFPKPNLNELPSYVQDAVGELMDNVRGIGHDRLAQAAQGFDGAQVPGLLVSDAENVQSPSRGGGSDIELV